jgi:hypothetical protein
MSFGPMEAIAAAQKREALAELLRLPDRQRIYKADTLSEQARILLLFALYTQDEDFLMYHINRGSDLKQASIAWTEHQNRQLEGQVAALRRENSELLFKLWGNEGA